MSTTTFSISPAYPALLSNRLHRWMTYGTVLAADTIAFCAAGTTAVFVRYLFHAKFVPSDWLSMAPAFLLFFVVFAFAGLYPGIGCSPTDEFRVILKASTISFLLLTMVSFFLRHDLALSRIVISLAWALTVVLVPTGRRALRTFAARQSWWGISTVIIGERKAGLMMLHRLQGHKRLGLKPVALLTEDRFEVETPVTGDESEHSPLLDHIFQGDFGHAPRFAERFPGCYALVAMPTSGSDRIREVVGEYACGYSNLLVVPDLFGMRSLSVSAKDICGVLTLQLDQRLTLALPRFCKRGFDLVLALSALLLMSPILLVLCLAVKLGSKGPIFYGQHRIGRNRQSFKVWKFRSMLVDADEVLRAQLEQNPELQAEWGRDHKLKNDPRITGAGRILRRSSLDELPQLWNVICGEMSLVGPRPIVDAEIAKYGECFEQYKRVRPGVTGLWQVSGRNNTSYTQRTRIDNYYVRNWSLSLDAYILLRTMKTILLSEGAY